MMCQRIGYPPTSTNGFGLTSVSSASLLPKPPAKITTFIVFTSAPHPPPFRIAGTYSGCPTSTWAGQLREYSHYIRLGLSQHPYCLLLERRRHRARRSE